MGTFDSYNEKIWELWQSFPDTTAREDARCPVQRSGVGDPDIVFVGMNPSFSEDWVQKCLDEALTQPQFANFKGIDPNQLFAFDSEAGNRRALIKAVDAISEEIHPYHTALASFAKSIGNELNLAWSAFDLFGWRETSQKAFLFRIHESKDRIRPFFRRQLDLVFETLRQVRPRAVVVANANACHILLKYHVPGATFDPESCAYQFKETDRLPFYFSGMLSGQRALDTYSRERLAWHLRELFCPS